jgi:endoglucanase
VTAVRLALSPAGWLGRRCSASQYAGWVDAAVAKANARGRYAIIDLHWSDVQGRAPCDTGCLTGQQNMPDADSLAFWRAVAARYANRPGVIFGLYNEPHDVSWACWRDGGCTTTSSALTGSVMSYKAVGMQQLVDAIRAAGANNLVLVLEHGQRSGDQPVDERVRQRRDDDRDQQGCGREQPAADATVSRPLAREMTS